LVDFLDAEKIYNNSSASFIKRLVLSLFCIPESRMSSIQNKDSSLSSTTMHIFAKTPALILICRPPYNLQQLKFPIAIVVSNYFSFIGFGSL